MAGSNAVAQNRISTVVGVTLAKGNFSTTSPNLPPIIAILGEANTANQTGLSTAPLQITSATQAGQVYGYGSPIHSEARILFPQSGGGVSCPVFVYAQAAAGSSTANTQTITITGTATATGTVLIYVAGRTNIDGASYAINVVTGDTPTVIAGKIVAAVGAALSAPCTAANTAGVVTLTAKWTGLTSQSLLYSVDATQPNNVTLGSTYVIAETVAGAGTPAITTSLNMFGNQWNNIIINTYGLVAATIGELETWNGVPDENAPTGRYDGIIFKPALALSGTVLDNPTSITGANARKTQCTIATCPAPLSPGLPYEAAANMAVLLSNVMANSPHSDVINQYYPDMPVPALGVVPAMNSYTVRDSYVQLGCSTVDLDGRYKVKDFVTTYRPDGETPPQYRFVRSLVIDFNVAFGWKDICLNEFLGYTLCADEDIVTAAKILKPRMAIGRGKAYAEDLGKRALIADVAFMQANFSASISTTNPDRLDCRYPYKRTGLGRIVATTQVAGFNFGS